MFANNSVSAHCYNQNIIEYQSVSKYVFEISAFQEKRLIHYSLDNSTLSEVTALGINFNVV